MRPGVRVPAPGSRSPHAAAPLSLMRAMSATSPLTYSAQPAASAASASTAQSASGCTACRNSTDSVRIGAESGSGAAPSVRTVDSAQYENRMNAFDFDITVDRWAQSLSPGNEQRNFWGSAAADQEGSRNTVGIKNPAVDKPI